MGNMFIESRLIEPLRNPTFGRSNEINACVNMLLRCVHGGYLWLDRPVSIDIDLIVCITGLPS
jgi:hypothetical protein